MVKVPDELYPNANHHRKIPIIDEYIQLSSESLKTYFPNKESLVSYLESFDRHEDTEDFIEVGRYIHKINSLGDPSIKILLLIALIEKVTMKNFMTITAWIGKLDEEIDTILTKLDAVGEVSKHKQLLKEELIRLGEKYYEKYGSRNNFADFIEKYVDKQDQFELILAFRTFYTDVVINYTSRWDSMPRVNTIQELQTKQYRVEKSLMPRCYDWKMCYVRSGSCCPQEGCLVKENDQKFSETIRYVAKKIYDMRSEIAHEASDKPLPKAKSEDVVYTNVLLMIDGKPAIIEMSIDRFQQIVISALMKYFENRPRKKI